MTWRRWKLKQTTMRYHYMSLRMAKIWNTGNTKCWWGTLIHCWWECKMIQPLWKTVWRFFTKLNIYLPYEEAIMVLGIYPKELKIYLHTKTCIWVFVSALFLIAKTWKQPMGPSGVKWVNCDTSRQWNINQCEKEMSYQAMKRRGKTLNAYY